MLHTDADLAITVEGPIEANNVGGVAFMQHLQLSDNLVPNGRLDFKVDQLKKKSQNKPTNINGCTKDCNGKNASLACFVTKAILMFYVNSLRVTDTMS